MQITHKFVEQDHAFALVGGLGTEPQTAVRQYLNDNKVPQLFVSTGATTFDRDYAQYPWTLGWQPDYEAEGSIYGKYIAKNLPTAKLGDPLPERRLRQRLPAWSQVRPDSDRTRRRSSTPSRYDLSAPRRLRYRWRS